MTGATPSTALPDTALVFGVSSDAPAFRTDGARQTPASLRLALYERFEAIEAEWRRFERLADCTPYQTYDWLLTWQRHIGRTEVRPVIAVASYANGETAFLLPLAVEHKRAVRRLCWLGQDLNDYNAPLLARNFSQNVSPECFLAAWRELLAHIQCEPMLRHDWIELEKMPPMVGAQTNPFCSLPVTENPSGAHFALLSGEWKKFYAAKRSSSTRRRDRTKLKHLSKFGDIAFMTAGDANDIRLTLETLIRQKSRLFARKGIADMFARPGWREFFLDIALNPPAARAGGVGIHVSRLQVGAMSAATNLGIVFGGAYYHMLASYDDGELSRYGAGALHLRRLMEYATELGLKRFDFTIGDEPYKLEWSDMHFKLFDYTSGATWRGWPVCSWSKLRRTVKRFIKQTPAAWRAASRVRALAGAVLHPAPAQQQPVERSAADGSSQPPLACVMGDMDLLYPIADAGIRCAVVTRPGVPSLYSRFVRWRLAWNDFSQNLDELVDMLVHFGNAQDEPPVLFYEEDAQLLMVSRFRERLARVFRFVIADAPLVENLVDKAQFQLLATRHELPVPRAHRFRPAELPPGDLQLRFPIILKPLTRLQRWNKSMGLHKALLAEDAAALSALWPRLMALDVDLLAQEFIAGAETQIESYHCYVDDGGGIAGEFTGRKIRTYPSAFGHTTALEITDAADVRRLGRAIAERLGLNGVAKFDFKRDADGRLHLLEINPRFTLWHHAGALAGVNIPAMVYADLTGAARPQAGRVRAGVRWCRPWSDFPAARQTGVPFAQWLAWTWHCEAKSSLSWDDPMPPVRSALHRLIARQAGGRKWSGS